jgi:hypothetical protein
VLDQGSGYVSGKHGFRFVEGSQDFFSPMYQFPPNMDTTYMVVMEKNPDL